MRFCGCFVLLRRFSVQKLILHYVSSKSPLRWLDRNSTLRPKFRRPSAELVFFCLRALCVCFGGLLVLLIFPTFFQLFDNKLLCVFVVLLFPAVLKFQGSISELKRSKIEYQSIGAFLVSFGLPSGHRIRSTISLNSWLWVAFFRV